MDLTKHFSLHFQSSTGVVQSDQDFSPSDLDDRPIMAQRSPSCRRGGPNVAAQHPGTSITVGVE